MATTTRRTALSPEMATIVTEYIRTRSSQLKLRSVEHAEAARVEELVGLRALAHGLKLTEALILSDTARAEEEAASE